MVKKDKKTNKEIVSIFIALIGAGVVGGLASLSHNGLLSIIGVLLGFTLGWVFYKFS